MQTRKAKTHIYTIRRYRDNSELGVVTLTKEQFAHYLRASGTPEGTIILSDLMDLVCSGNVYDCFQFNSAAQNTNTTVYLEE